MERNSSKEYKLTFKHSEYHKSDSEYKDGDWVCIFLEGRKEVALRRTKTLEAADLKPGQEYIIKFDPFRNPCYVKGNKLEVIKNGSRIIQHDLVKDTYYNLTAGVFVDKNYKPLKGEKLSDGIQNYNRAAMNKFNRGELSEGLLLKMNKRGIYFTIRSYVSKGNSFYNFSQGISKEPPNRIHIEKESQQEVNEQLKNIKERYLSNDIEKHFEITTSVIPPKRKKK